MIAFLVKFYFLLNIFQQAYYDYPLYFDWLKKHFVRNNILFVFLLLMFFYRQWYIYLLLMLCSVIYFIYYFKKEKKHLKITKRVVRLIIVFILLSLISKLFLPYFIIFLLADIILLLTNVFLMPIEKMIDRYYINQARKKINNHASVKIAITGSFGKTSVKNFCQQALSNRFYVKASPKSYNTPLGIAKFINAENFDMVDFIIYEFGARHPKDILELRNLYKYDLAIVTEVGVMHLDTFHSIDNILDTKMDILNGLNSDGIAILNYENDLIRNYPIKCKVKSFGFNYGTYQARNIKLGLSESTFDLFIANKFVKTIKTSLIGKHMILNLLPAIIICDLFNIDYQVVEKTTSVDNRLQYRRVNDFHLLMDAYNSNLVGAKNALEVVKMHSGKRFIITPGFVESNQLIVELANEYERVINESVDVALLIDNDFTNLMKEKLIVPYHTFVGFDIAYNFFLTNHQQDSLLIVENDWLDVYLK